MSMRLGSVRLEEYVVTTENKKGGAIDIGNWQLGILKWVNKLWRNEKQNKMIQQALIIYSLLFRILG
jgi:hypothetical protein